MKKVISNQITISNSPPTHSTKKKKQSKNKLNKNKNKNYVKISTIMNIYDKGVKFFDEKYFIQALEKLAIVLKTKPNCPTAHYYSSMCNFNLKKYDLANNSIEIALKLNQKDIDFKIMKAHILQCTGKIQESLEIYNHILSKKPNNDKALVGKSEAVLKLNKINLAKKYMEMAIDINSSCANYHNNLGFLQTKLEDNESINSYSHAIQLNSFHLDSYFNKTQELIKLKKYEEALICLNVGIQKFPNKGLLYFERGFILYLLDKDREAIYDFEQSIRLNHQVAESYSYIGDCYFYLKEYDKALENFKKCYKMDLHNDEYLFDIADTYFQLGNYEESENLLIALQRKLKINVNLKSEIETLMTNIKNKKSTFSNRIVLYYDQQKDSYQINEIYFMNRPSEKIEEPYENINAIMEYETEFSVQDF